MEEIWKDIEGYEGRYQVSNLGNVKSLNYNKTGKEHLLSLGVIKGDYLQANLWKSGKPKGYLVHRLVAEAFLDKRNFKYVDEQDRIDNLNLENLEINHIIEGEEGKKNNCVENIEWVTPYYNREYGTRNERIAKTQRNDPNRSKKVYQYDLEGNFITEWASTHEVERQLGFNYRHISACCRGKLKTYCSFIWKYKEEVDNVND